MADESMDAMAAALQAVSLRPDGPRAVLELLANLAMREEVAAHVGAAPHERSAGRRGRRNGTKSRARWTRGSARRPWTSRRCAGASRTTRRCSTGGSGASGR
jgi:transposase-like protein